MMSRNDKSFSTSSSLHSSSSNEKITEAAMEPNKEKDEKIQSSKRQIENQPFNSSDAILGHQKIIAQGSEAEELAVRYAETLSRHSRLNPNNVPSFHARLILVIFVTLLFWWAIQGRLQVIEWKRTLHIEPYDEDYTDMNHLSPMAENYQMAVTTQGGHLEL